MTANGSSEISVAGNDDAPYPFEYGHARMPLFMKLVWIAFLLFSTVYVVQYLLTSIGEDLGV